MDFMDGADPSFCGAAGLLDGGADEFQRSANESDIVKGVDLLL